MKTIICDIDGTLIPHTGEGGIQHLKDIKEVLPNVRKALHEWNKKSYNVILISGRRESTRKATEEQLSKLGITYDQLILGVGAGERVLINDCKPDGKTTARAINLVRNEGLTEEVLNL